MGIVKNINVDEICQGYLDGMNIAELSRKYNVSYITIKKRIESSNNKCAIEKLRYRDINPNIIIDDFINNDIKIADLAKKYYKDTNYIKDILESTKNKQVYMKLFDVENRQGEDKEYHIKLVDYFINYYKNDMATNIEKLREVYINDKKSLEKYDKEVIKLKSEYIGKVYNYKDEVVIVVVELENFICSCIVLKSYNNKYKIGDALKFEINVIKDLKQIYI